MMKPGNTMRLGIAALLSIALLTDSAVSAEPPTTYNQVAPIFAKYCVGCHNADDAEGKLSLESFADLQKGGEHGPAVVPGQSGSSRLIRMLTGKTEPAMPPEDEPQPNPDEVALLAAWIDAGAVGPDGAEPDRTRLLVPKIKPASTVSRPITALAVSPTGDYALARFRKIELYDDEGNPFRQTIAGLPGKVTSLSYTGDGRWLVVASGINGLYGHARIYHADDHTLLAEFTGHRDILYAAVVDPGKKILATGGYDRRIILWNFATGKQIRTLSGHNHAIYDLAFSPDGSVLASASGDETVKLWNVATGQRLDTLGQPLAEQYAVAFSPDGRNIVAGGGDSRVRVWRYVSREKQRINPLRYARFGHERAIVSLAFSPNGRVLATTSEDRSIKLWETKTFTQFHAYANQPDVVSALAFHPSGEKLMVARLDGSHKFLSIPTAAARSASDRAVSSVVATIITDADSMQTVDESEPNDDANTANTIAIPATVGGVIDGGQRIGDVDLFRFTARAGEQWILEINAARSKSLLDSKIEVLDANGRRVPRVLLRAVRDSYFTFRGKDSDTSDDFRVHNWEEMELNELLYANGEVVKLFHYPRGPDSGFRVYPGNGRRHAFFDTTPISHALHEPCYVVEPFPPGSQFVPNGLPVFPVHFENDDDALRRWGSDSQLTFTAPADSEYIVRVSDARGFHGEDYKYTLTIRPRRPDFKVTLHGANPEVGKASGTKVRVTVERVDGFDGEVRIDVDGIPPGFHVSSPLVIQSGHLTAYGAIYALPDATVPAEKHKKSTTVSATAMIGGQEVVKSVNNLGEVKLAAKPPGLLVTLSPPDALRPNAPAATEKTISYPTLTIAPGETIRATLRVERRGHRGLVAFGKDEAGWNLPHGIFVDNIGLNGVLVPDGAAERSVYITAAKWVPETTRPFFLESQQAGKQCCWPVQLEVRNR